MALLSVLKYEGDNQTFVWKHPKTEFNLGSQLIVHESQEAIFMVNGEVLDTFGPGKHTLETENLPVAKSLMKLGTGGQSPFHAELYFVNKVEQMAIKWGTDSKIQYLDPVFDFPLEIGACGQMSLAVSNSNKLLIKVVGTEKNLSREQLTLYFRAFLMTRVKSIMPRTIVEKKISIFSMDQYLSELSELIKVQLQDDFYDYGVDLKMFLITTVLKPDEDRNYIKFKDLYSRKYIDVAEAELKQKLSIIEEQTRAQQTVIEAQAIARKRELEGYTYQQEQSFEVAKEIARNDAVAEFGNIGIGIGMGMLSGIGGEMAQQVGSMAAAAVKPVSTQPPAPVQYCMNCGEKLTQGAQFCMMCGTKVETKNATCTNCGYEFSNEAKFCPNCGTKRG